jgi:hypothetical protein
MLSARTSLRVVLVFLISLAVSAYAVQASDFTGAYTLGAATPAGHDVQVTISLTVANNTSANIGDAAISLHDPRAARVIYGQLTGVSLAAGGQAQVSGSFTVPRSLYKTWQQGSAPAMSVSFNDAHGNPVQAFIEF